MSEHDTLTLQLAAATYRFPGRREADALELLGLTPTRFWARVHALLEDPVAEATMPAEVHRLRRLRDARRDSRTMA